MTQQQSGTQAKKRAAGFMTALGVVANISAVAGLVFSTDFSLFVQFAAVAGVTVGVYLLIRQWGKPVGARVLFAIACITAGSVVGALSLDAAAPWSHGDGKTSQFKLVTYQGIDLDSSKRQVVDTDGPNGDIDIFMGEYSYLVANNGALYVDEGSDNEIYNRCTRALTMQRDPQQKVLPQTDVRLCFKTSEGRIGWLRVNDADFDTPAYAVINVRIW